MNTDIILAVKRLDATIIRYNQITRKSIKYYLKGLNYRYNTLEKCSDLSIYISDSVVYRNIEDFTAVLEASDTVLIFTQAAWKEMPH